MSSQSGYIKGKPDTSFWMTQIRKGIAYRKKYASESEWPRWRRYYRGQWPPNTLAVNLFFRMVRTIVPRVYFRNPSISITSTRAGAEYQALCQIIERIDNKLIRTMKTKRYMKRVVQHAWMFGTGALMSGFGGQGSYVPEDMGDTNLPVHNGERVEYQEVLRDNMPWLLPLHPGSLIVPAGLQTFDETRWFAQWIRRPLYDVETDPRLRNNKGLKPSMGTEGVKIQLSDGGSTAPLDMVDLVVVRDKKLRKVFVMAPYSQPGKTLLFEDDDLQINGRMGCYPLVFNEDDEVFWGVPDSVILDPQQREMNEIRTLQMKHRRQSIVKAFAKRSALKAEEIEKMTDEQVLSVVQIDGEMSDVLFREVAQEPPGLRLAGQEVLNDVRENLGFSRNQFGNYSEGSSDKTATEAQIVQAASEIRIDERRDMVADLLTDSITDINTVVFDQWQEEQIQGLIGPDGLPIWVAFRPQVLKGAEYIMNIDPDSSLPETKALRSQRAEKLYMIFKENPLIDPEKLTKYLLREEHGVDFDDMMRSIGVMRDQPGGNPGQPIGIEQYVQQLAGAQRPPGA